MIGRFSAWFLAQWPLYATYSALALAVLAPLLLPGFILTLDMVFVPHPPLPEIVRSSYPFHALLHGLSFVIPADVLQKIMLFIILLASGLGAHRLAQYTLANQAAVWRWAYFVAGTLYMINPFTYSRFMAGQYAVLLGYAFLPFFVCSLLRFIAAPGLRGALVMAGWATLISIVSIHSAGLLVVLVLFAAGAGLWRHRQDTAHVKRMAVWAIAGVGIWFALNSYWLLPFLTGSSATAQAVSQFDAIDRHAFATIGGNAFEILLNVLRLQGFWAESRGLFTLPQQTVPLWGLLFLLLLALVGAGFVYMWRNRRFALVVIGGSGLLAALLASGLLGDVLAQVIPFFAGYREPHKFAAIVALAYAVAASAGIAVLTKKIQNTLANIATAGATILCLALALPMLWGFGGQLAPAHYPAEWYHANQTLNQAAERGKVLFLPWHAYMTFGFSGRIIENPAPGFFDRPIIASNDPEYKNVQPTYPNPHISQVNDLLKNPNHQTLAQNLADLGVSHIILAKEYDFADFAYMGRLPGVQLIQDSDQLALYRIDMYKEGQ